MVSGGATTVTNNGGTITGTNNVGVLVNGGSSNVIITNGGMISGSTNGINTNTTGTTTITNTATIMDTNGGATPGAIRVNTASITNMGAVSGDFAVFFRDGNGASTIFDAGTLTGTGGTAIHFSAGSVGNTLTLAPGFSISGTVAGTGSDILQLGGTGTGTFNASNIGASAQYQGFTTFNKIDVSTWTLTGTGAANQNWNISGGTLAGDTNSIQSATVAISNNARLDFNQSFNGAFAGSITGTGSLQKDGAGTVILTGASSYTGLTTIAAGTLQIGNGGTTGTLGASAGTITDNGTLAFDRSDTVTLSNVISGTGGLSQSGTGTLILTGASNYGGPTNVNAGVLAVTGSLTSTVNVNSGGTLTGTGTVGGIQVAGGGTLQPGALGTFGTLNVSGGVTFAPNSTFQVRANAAGQSDMLAATGTTKINGGSVLVLSQNGTYAPQTNYTIITSNGGVNGQFVGVADSLTFLSPSLTYNTNAVVLTLVKVDLTTAATTPNQLAVAKALDQGPVTNPLILALLNTNTAGGQQAFDALSGEVFASLQSALFGGSFVLRLEVLERLREAGYFGAPGPLGALALGYQDVVPGDAVLGDLVPGGEDAGSALGYRNGRRRWRRWAGRR